MSDVEGSNSGTGSDFDPDGEPDISPVRPVQTSNSRKSSNSNVGNSATSNYRRTASPTTTSRAANTSTGSGATGQPKTPPPKRGRPRKGTVPDHPRTPTPSNALTSKPLAGPPSPVSPTSPISPTSPTTANNSQGHGTSNQRNRANSNQSAQSQTQAPAQSQSQAQQQTQMMPQGYLAMGPGGLPILLQNASGNVNAGDRTQLYALLRQMPFGGLPRDGSQGNGVGTAPLPFPFPMHPGLLAGPAMSNDPIPSAHDAEAPPGERSDSPGRVPGPLGVMGGVMGSPSKGRPAPGTMEWARQRKDNHKEVERRRRGNINDGINELSRLIPIGQGDKAKGAVLARAVQYITQLKDAEQRNVEKWTMEKLTNDSVVEDWRRKCDDIEDRYERERARREELEVEVARLRKLLGLGAFQPSTSLNTNTIAYTNSNRGPSGASTASASAPSQVSTLRTRNQLEADEGMDFEEDELEEDDDGAEEDDERPAKRIRVS